MHLARPRAQWAVLVGVCVALALALLGCAPTSQAAKQAEREVVYAIQPGTAARQNAGEKVSFLPPTINMRLGQKDVLVIRNDDADPITIDSVRVMPGQRVTQRFYNKGTFELVCSNDSHMEKVKIVVE